MKKILCLTAVGVALALAGPASAKFKRIKTEADFIKLVVGKSMTLENGSTAKITADGKFSGNIVGGPKFSGVWKWSGRFWCRNGLSDGKEMGSDCQVFEIDGKQLKNIREKGRGGSLIWTLQ